MSKRGCLNTKDQWIDYTIKCLKDMCNKNSWNFNQKDNRIEISTNQYSYGFIQFNKNEVEYDFMLNVRIELAKNYGINL